MSKFFQHVSESRVAIKTRLHWCYSGTVCCYELIFVAGGSEGEEPNCVDSCQVTS
jgi:hypothetical protein